MGYKRYVQKTEGVWRSLGRPGAGAWLMTLLSRACRAGDEPQGGISHIYRFCQKHKLDSQW